MPRDVSILFVHGINVSDQNYAQPAIERLRKRLPKAIRHHAKFGSAFWADIVRPHQRAFFERASGAAGLTRSAARTFALEGLGDAAAYQKTPKRYDAPYFRIQAKVREALLALDSVADPSRPLVVIGHSLGCHILSSFIWDVNNIKQANAADFGGDKLTEKFQKALMEGSPFQRLDTLAGIVTMGSNMPLFTFTFERKDVMPITKARPGRIPAFPGRSLSPELAQRAKWLNFFSRNDLLGYPLKPLYELGDDHTLLQDIPVRSEGLLASIAIPSPFNAIRAHTRYDRNRQVLRKTAKLIQDVIEV